MRAPAANIGRVIWSREPDSGAYKVHIKVHIIEGRFRQGLSVSGEQIAIMKE
jgi:hypothetical protein